ncbi:cytochrome-c peroxidase [Methylocystis parvus]|uniref:C-type cytochrome n=1 Tax=Methylocystis parvus TaxID=134 RepID=A0A6B8M3C3_9HYPH|nr:cytochrome c peroxidase [Methylocystis parvus]QGM96856.1 c-type cytochrome [Methylocystis parvus]WBJ99264.1 c-type cytochrome [Methylocystis parvus OBBP]
MRHSLIASLVALLSFGAGVAHAEDALRDQAKGLFEPIPRTAPALPDNPATPEKLELGKMLYFEPRLSDSRSFACATCHNLSMGGVDGGALSSGNAQLAGREVQTVFNAVFNKSQYWDGRAADLKDQVVNSVMANPKAMLKTRGGPMAINPTELAATKQREIDQLKAIPGYAGAFRKAFPADADPLVYDNIGRAIAVFEATMITPDSAFDRWLTGDDAALDETQKAGLKLFIDKGCASCHNGVNIGGASYAKFGVVANPGPEHLPAEDAGRYVVTKNNADRYVFKVPSLRNVELTAPYFHAGSTFDLKKAVTVMAESQLGAKLAEDETTKIVAFLKTLTGKQPEIVLPILPPRDR